MALSRLRISPQTPHLFSKLGPYLPQISFRSRIVTLHHVWRSILPPLPLSPPLPPARLRPRRTMYRTLPIPSQSLLSSVRSLNAHAEGADLTDLAEQEIVDTTQRNGTVPVNSTISPSPLRSLLDVIREADGRAHSWDQMQTVNHPHRRADQRPGGLRHALLHSQPLVLDRADLDKIGSYPNHPSSDREAWTWRPGFKGLDRPRGGLYHSPRRNRHRELGLGLLKVQ
jgi:hypothetical protein